MDYLFLNRLIDMDSSLVILVKTCVSLMGNIPRFLVDHPTDRHIRLREFEETLQYAEARRKRERSKIGKKK